MREAKELAEARDSWIAHHAKAVGELQGSKHPYAYAFAHVCMRACKYTHTRIRPPHMHISWHEDIHACMHKCMRINSCRHDGASSHVASIFEGRRREVVQSRGCASECARGEGK